MTEKRFQIGLCTEVPSLIDQVTRFTESRNIDLTLSVTSLENAIPEAERMKESGTEVILAGTDTSIVITEQVDIPVVSVKVELVEFIETLMRAADTTDRIFYPVFRVMPTKEISMARILNVQIDQFIYNGIESARQCLDQAKKDGYKLAVGSGFITRYARQIGIATISYNRSDEVVQQAIDNAIAVIRFNREAREETLRYRTILDTASEGVIAIDQSGIVTEINQVACSLLDVQEKSVTGSMVREVIPESAIHHAVANNRPVSNSIEKYRGKSFVWNHQPFEVAGEVSGCVSTFSEVSSVMRKENKIRRTKSKGHKARYKIGDILHQSTVMHKTIQRAMIYAETDTSLLVSGETGTGKELLVQGVHNLSQRRKAPFVSINCAALPDELLESELFGYEEGAFTGSRKGGKAGLFELANKGTIFLDEIGETSEQVQIRLLRVLQEREIMRLGGDRLVPIDIRVIAASNRDLVQEVHKGDFRSDLLFRLNILHIEIPPLRDRLEDIPVLLTHFIHSYSHQNGSSPFEVPHQNIELLKRYQWPGNVRQLQNFAEQLVLLSDSSFDNTIFSNIFAALIDHHQKMHPHQTDFDDIRPRTSPADQPVASPAEEEGLEARIEQIKLENEKRILLAALEGTKYSKGKAARLLRMSRSTLWRKMKEVGLE